jgi:hypothetical protein
MQSLGTKNIKRIVSLIAFISLIALFIIPTLTLAPTSGRNQSVATRGMPPVPPIPASSLSETQIARAPKAVSLPEERARALFDIQIQALLQESPVMPFLMMIAGILAGMLGYTFYAWKMKDYFNRVLRRFREKSHIP